MVTKIIILISQIFLASCESSLVRAETLIKVGYYYPREKQFLVSDIKSSLFTHLVFCCADLQSTSYQLSLSTFDESYVSNFTETVRQKNPSVITLLSIGGSNANYSIYSSMVSNSSFRKSFIDSSITTARHYGFGGLDLYWSDPKAASNMANLIIFFKEWRSAVNLQSRNSGNQSQLILTTVLQGSPNFYSEDYRIDMVQQYLNWSNVDALDFSTPWTTNFTTAPSLLYDPSNISSNTDNCIRGWIDAGLSANKIVFCFPYYGFAWKLANAMDNGIYAPAVGPAISEFGVLEYDEIKNYVARFNANITYNSTYVVNYCTVGTSWIGFDDVEAIQAKVSYIKEKGLLGYNVWQVSYDDNWVLSQAAADAAISHPQQGANISPAQENNDSEQNKRPHRLLAIIFPATAAVMLPLGLVIYFKWKRKLKSKASADSGQETRSKANKAAAAGDFNGNAPNLVLYSLAEVEAATENFSIEKKLGQGGYGPVYKGILADGQEVAIKKLSQTSVQGFGEFKNEVTLTAKLQHVNLVRLLGFCIDREEHMLIYEYMSNKSLDCYLFDLVKKYILDWEKRIHIIEGVCQGLLYLQEYSRLTIIHRDLKPSNVLLDQDMKPKISDFGMARIFTKDNLEANTERIVGTYGYISPEYVKKGTYSTKSDVYSFGVLLLQIISGKRVSILYGENDHLSLLEYAYELWKDGKGMEFMDPSLDDTSSPCRLIKCLHIALLCVQEIPIDRPSMLEVVWMLRNEATNLTIPKKLAFSKQIDEGVQYDSTTSNLEIVSVNETTISDLEAR